ncbi:MAG: glycosyltransferase family 39 protein [Verrucomicrobiota bacterium]
MTTNTRRLWIVAVLLAFAGGIALRVMPLASFTQPGFDEVLYRFYVGNVLKNGILEYPQIVDSYIEKQKTLKGSILPPLRFLYIGTSSLLCSVTGEPPLTGLRQIASLFSILTLGVAFVFMLRLAGRGAALAVLALMACAPTQIHMSQHAMVDGFFTFWATLSLWLLWENLIRPSRPALLGVYAASLALMVMTKENSAFVVIAILALLVANRWAGFGTVNRPLVLATILGPAVGVGVLITLAGGLESFFTCYILSVSKNFTLDFAIKTGDGPWYRYLVDLMLVSPIVLILALGALFQLNRPQRPQLFVAIFIAASYLIMCNLKYGMNLRYANMWDAPLRLLAFTQLSVLVARFGGKRQEFWLALSVVAVCAYELRQYWILAMEFPHFYELVPETLLRALNILK